jgi:hypothetical protein
MRLCGDLDHPVEPTVLRRHGPKSELRRRVVVPRFGTVEKARRGDLVLAVVAIAIVVVALAPRLRGSAGAHAIVADPRRTPGVLNPNVTQANIRSTICRRGWTSTIRPPVSYTDALKRKQMREYGETGPMSAYQEDHLISLEMGGNPTDPRNLWPEPYPRAAQMDQIENQLNSEICDGQLTLAQAQQKESEIKHTQG